MIEQAKKEYSSDEIASILDPTIKKWFFSKFKDFAPPQKFAVREIHSGKNVLISSPTGSGKTLSAFLAVINELFILARNDMLEDKVYCLYVSPLRALSNDIERNLNEPLREIYELAAAEGLKLPAIRVGKRTGDTPPAERARQLKQTPHVFITTPETSALVLNSPKLSEKFREVRWVIVDEVHALAENKRGTNLSLAIERLCYYIAHKPVRIGLSATIAPLEEVARFLVGYENGQERDCIIVDASWSKTTELSVLSPARDLIYTSAGELHNSLYTALDQLISAHKTTLIFTNTRSGTERVVHYLKEKFGEKYVQSIEAHHGSLAKELRLNVEERLKRGELKAVVCSTSLELGIDIGYIDLVILLGSPKSVTRALQRVGRSGHKLQDTVKGRFVVLDRDDLVECVVMTEAARRKFLDKVQMPKNCLDVLSQHLIGMSLEKRWKVDEAYELVRHAYPYCSLSYEDFLSVLRYLAGSHAELEIRNVYAKLWFDEDSQEFGKKGKLMRMIYYTNIGTIPEESSAQIFLVGDGEKKGNLIGSVDEDFLEDIKDGDRFVLGGRVYEFQFSRGMKGYVTAAYERLPTIPSWFSETLPLSYDLAQKINSFRFEMWQRFVKRVREEDIILWLKEKYGVDEKTAHALYGYFREQHLFLGIPTGNEIFIENYVDELERQNIIFHTLFGRRTNDALSRAYAYVISKKKKTNVRVAISDNGFVLIVPGEKRINPREIVEYVSDENIEELLRTALEGTELLKRRFRHVATRSLMILRSYKGRRKSVGRQQMSSHFLYHILKRVDPNFPVLKETYREILEDAMDIGHAKEVLKKIRENKARFVVCKARELPSPFAHNLVMQGTADVMMMESRKELLKLLHKQVLRQIGEENGAENGENGNGSGGRI